MAAMARNCWRLFPLWIAVVGAASVPPASPYPPLCSSGRGAARGAAFVPAGAFSPSLLPCRPGTAAALVGGQAPVGAPLASPRRDRAQSLVGPKAIMDRFVSGMQEITAGLSDALAGPEKEDVNALRDALGDQEFDAVKDLVSKLMAQQRKEMREIKSQSAAEQKKLQRELNGYSNKVRDLEFQLIMAANEVTDLEEQISDYKYELVGDEEAPVQLRGRPANPEEHPVFGTLISDFGYKKVYAADPATIYSKVPIYKKQRTFRTERASAMAEAKAKMGVAGWPGTITVVELDEQAKSETGDVTDHVLVDGQHRLGAYTILSRRLKSRNPGQPLPSGMGEMLVEVYPRATDEMAAEVFTEINKAEPCKLVDLPGQAGAPPEVRAVIDAAAEELRRKHANMFKPSEKCRTPHMNIDNLRDELWQSGVVTRMGFTEGDQLLQWMLDKNARLGEIPDEEWTPKRRSRASTLQNALAKARANDFYLGLEWDWINDDEAVAGEAEGGAV